MKNLHKLPLLVSIFVGFILSSIQLQVETPMLMLERFIQGGGWIEIVIIVAYSYFLTYKMQQIAGSAKWRLISWTVFSVFFFSQLLLGILVSEKFLLTGKLHIPVPAMMISGPIYRGQLSIMTLLFLSTLILSGPAWCSHLCYFGAIDGIASNKGKTHSGPIKSQFRFKGVILVTIIIVTILLRILEVSTFYATIGGILFGFIGLIILATLSTRKGKMMHCTLYCPIGSVVNILKYISPFRMYIDKSSCTLCMRCRPACKYDALNINNIKNYKPGFNCTLCGDCLNSCKDNSIRYKFFQAKPETARRIYLFVTISLHAIFMAMGRI